MVKSNKLILYAPFLCSAALVGRVLWWATSPSDLDHRLALEVTREKQTKLRAKKRRSLSGGSAVSGMDLDISIQEKEGGYDMKMEVDKKHDFKNNKDGKVSPLHKRAIKKLETMSMTAPGNDFYPEAERIHVFPSNVDLKNFNPAYLLEVYVNVKSERERLNFQLYDKDTMHRLIDRHATENKGERVLAVPVGEAGNYLLRIMDEQGHILKEGNHDDMEISINKVELVRNGADGKVPAVEMGLKKELNLEVGNKPNVKGMNAFKHSIPHQRFISKLESMTTGSSFKPDVERIHLFPNNLDFHNFNPAYLLEVFVKVDAENEHLTFQLYDKETSHRLIDRTSTENRGERVFAVPLNVGNYLVRMMDKEGLVLAEGAHGDVEIIVNQAELVHNEDTTE